VSVRRQVLQLSVKDRTAPFLPLSDRLPFWMRCLRILFPLMLVGLASCAGSAKPSAALSSLRASSVSTTAGVTATSTAVASTAGAVTVPASTTSTAIVYESNEKAAGGEIISNDKKLSYDVVFQMVLVGKRWLIAETTNQTKYEGTNTYPAK
jgi:hypothetical protein